MRALKSIAVVSVLAGLMGCASKPVMMPSVGPNPRTFPMATAYGQLEVYSALVGRSEGDNPSWTQHADYAVYDASGRLMKKVWNVTGYYDAGPRRLKLPPGSYLVKATAADYFQAEVPVMIQAGKVTRVHLDDAWPAPVHARNGDVAFSPDGHAIGWRAKPSKAVNF